MSDLSDYKRMVSDPTEQALRDQLGAAVRNGHREKARADKAEAQLAKARRWFATAIREAKDDHETSEFIAWLEDGLATLNVQGGH